MHHLFERRGDEPAQADQIGVAVTGGLQNLVAGHHHSKVNHVIIVAPKHHADDVLADIVDVAFHSRHDDASFDERAAAGLLFRFEVRLQIGHSLFHHPRALDHLRQEHPP